MKTKLLIIGASIFNPPVVMVYGSLVAFSMCVDWIFKNHESEMFLNVGQ